MPLPIRHRPAPSAAAALLLVSLAAPAAPAAADEPRHHEHPAGHEHGGHDHAGHDHGCHGESPGPDQPGHVPHHRFDDPERWSKVFDDPARDAWQRPAEVVRLLELEPGMAVADLGAGTGYFLGHLAGAVGPGGRVLGLDVEESLVEHMNQRAADSGWSNVEARQVPFDAPGLDDGAVDRVLIVNTWHHIADRPAYGAELRRALADGGRVVVVDYTMDSPSGPAKEHRLLPQQVMEELRAAGFEVRLLDEDLPRQYVVEGRK